MENKKIKVLFLGETFRADAQTWLSGVKRFLDCDIETLEIKNSASKSGRVINGLRFLLKLLRKRKTVFDLVLAERSTSYGFFALFSKRKVLVVAQQGVTDVYPDNWTSRLFKAPLKKLVYRHADLIHAWGHVMVPAMLKHGATPLKIMVRPKGIDLDNFTFSRKKDIAPSEHLAIVTRSFKSYYNHAVILNAISMLKEMSVPIKFLFVGGGELLKDSKDQAETLGISEMVKFLGTINNKDLPLLLSKSSIYVSIPQTEGVSASLFEAMATGCFPIVSDLAGNRAFIKNGINGLLVDCNNAASLAEAISAYCLNFEKFQDQVVQNRHYIESNANLDKNFKIICEKYSSLFLEN